MQLCEVHWCLLLRHYWKLLRDGSQANAMLYSPSLRDGKSSKKPVLCLFFFGGSIWTSKAPGPRDLVPVLRLGEHKAKVFGKKEKRSLWPSDSDISRRSRGRAVCDSAATVPPNLSVRAWPSASRGIGRSASKSRA